MLYATSDDGIVGFSVLLAALILGLLVLWWRKRRAQAHVDRKKDAQTSQHQIDAYQLQPRPVHRSVIGLPPAELRDPDQRSPRAPVKSPSTQRQMHEMSTGPFTVPELTAE